MLKNKQRIFLTATFNILWSVSVKYCVQRDHSCLKFCVFPVQSSGPLYTATLPWAISPNLCNISPVSVWFPLSSVPEKQRGCQQYSPGHSAAGATGPSWTLGHSSHSGTPSGWSASSCYPGAATHTRSGREEKKKTCPLK